MAKPEKHVLVCTHARSEDDPKGSCSSRGASPLVDAMSKAIGERNLWGRIKFNITSCMGACEHGPVMLIYPDSVMYGKVQPEDVNRIIEEHLLGGKPIEDLKVPADVWD